MSILCATDFSLCARTAAELAAALARRLGQRLRLLHVIEPSFMAVPEAGVAAGAWVPQVQAAAEARLASWCRDLERQGIVVESQVVAGMAAEAVLAAARTAGARLLVVGTHGRQGPARLLLGSVAAEVVRGAEIPVLVARAGAADPARWAEGGLHLAAAVDGTGASESALAWVADTPLADRVTVVRVYWPPTEARRYGIDDPWLGNEGHPRLLRLVERDLRASIGPLAAGPHTALRFRTASVYPELPLLEEARRARADALVIGVSRRSPSTWNALETRSAIQQSPLPVFCIPEPARHRVAEIPPLRTVLVATDLSEPSNRAVAHAFELLRRQGGRVQICHVHERGRSGPSGELPLLPALSDEERAATVARLRALVPANGAARGIHAHAEVIEGDLAPESIVQAAERVGADVIVLASHGRSGWKRATLGSVAELVARRSSRPVLLIRRDDREGGSHET